MGSQEFIVLYTHQKTKKSKVWQDGILKVTHLGNKAILYDDKGDCLESIFLKHLEVKPGDDLESDRYLITVEEVKGAGSIALKHDVVKEAPELKSRRFVSSGRSLGCQPAGLKRKFPGFLGPYQVPKKMVATENGQPAASLEAKKPGPTFLSPLYSMSPLFSTASQKDTKNIPTDSNNTVTYKNRERNDLLSSSVVSTPSFKIYPEVLCRENYFCSADSSVSKDADSLVANKPMKRDRLTSHCSGISQNIRSKAQILALLKSKSTSTGKELNSENTDHFPQIHPQESIKIPAKPKCLFEQEKCTEVKSIETLHYQHQSESAMRNKSQWAMYLSSQSSLIHSSDIDESGTERKHKVQEDDINANMKDLLIQKKFFETDCEMGEKYNEDKQVDDNHPSSWDQEVNFEITSSNKSASLPGNYSNAENNGLLSVPHVQGNNKISLNHNDQVCVKGPIITRENSLEVNTCGTPEIECKQPVSSLTDWEHIQIESSLSNDFGISDDSSGMFSKSNANHEGINSINEPMSDVPQPFLEITFNLNNFETSDTEEEPQEGSKISQDSECLVKEMLVNDNSCVQKRCENKSYKEIGSENLPLSMSVGGKPIEPLPTRDTLPTQLSARTRVDFDTGTFKAENTGKERKEFSDTLSNFDSEWTGDMCVDSNEDANKSIQKIKTDCDVVSLSNKFKGIETNLHIHQFLGVATDQTPENNTLFTEDTQPQPFILGSNLDKTDDQVFSSPSSNDNSIQLLNTNQSHSEYIALDESTTQVSNTSFYPLREKSSFSKEPEAHSPGSKDLGTIGSLSHEHTEIESAENCKRDWNNSGNSSGLSGLVNNISLLRSLSEHSTALESLEVFQKKNTSKQQGFQQTSAPESSPEDIIPDGSPQVTCSNSPSNTAEDPGLVSGFRQDYSQLNSVEYGVFPNEHINKEMSQDNILTGSKPLTTVVSQAIPKLHLLNQDSPPQLFTLQNEEKNGFLTVISKQVETCDPKLVEFQGHQVKGSATSAVMVRAHSSQLECSLFPDSTENENSMTDSCFQTSSLPGTCMPINFLQFPDKEIFPKGGTSFNIEDNFQMIAESDKESIENYCFPPSNSEHSYHYLDYNFKSAKRTLWEANKVTSSEQKISTLIPVSTFSLPSRDEDFMPEFSNESLRARTLHGMKKPSSLEKKNFQRLPLVSRARVPIITLPPADGPPDLDSCSYVINCDTQESSDSPKFNLWEESAFPSFNFEPEDQSEAFFFEDSEEETPGGLSLLNNVSTESKWLKYQSTPQCNLTTLDKVDKKVRDVFFAEAISRMHFSDTGERQSDAMNKSSLDSLHLQMMKGMLYQQQQKFSSQDLISRNTALSLNLEQTFKTEEIQTMLGESAYYSCSITSNVQEINASELSFPSGQKIKSVYLPQRQIHIPAVFQSPAHYKQIFTSCLIEHLNILLFTLSQKLYKALSNIDISFYTSSKGEKQKNVENNVPSCHHHQPAKLVMVKKEGPNKGRLFYTCDGPKADRCKFFKWLEEVSPGLTQAEYRPSMVLSDIKSIGLYLRSQKIPLYEECQLLVRKGCDFQGKRYGKLKKFTTVNPEFYNEPKSKLYLKLSRKESSSSYSKNDLWVVSKTLDFELDTFIACSAFFGPSSVNEVELLPLKGYFPSKWPTNIVVHALLVCNASTELTTLKNIQNYFNPGTLPLMQHLLTMSSPSTVSNKRVNKKKFIPPAFTNTNTKFEISPGTTLQLASELIQVHKLNKDQATALIQIAEMMASHESVGMEEMQPHTLPITIIHGVFGAGKSYLLAVVILFFVQLFEKSEATTVGNARPWKLLISSSTNVAVDRVLLGLLSLGFEKFVRVGSVRKIAKPILPYSLHAGSENENEQLKELHALMKEDLTPVERLYVRKSIEQHKLGTNRTLLKQVRVVGVTCAACPFPCLNDLKFPVVVLDESSQITEPASLLPIARFECEKLILVGDPKQLPPTIQGSDAAHENGLEQTLFDRLCLMGHKPVILRTQYRCHPAISAIANDLFYEGNLMNGVSETERSPLLEWLPTLCFYNVKGLEQIERDNSFHNVAEAAFTLKLIQSLIASGIAGYMIGVITLYKSQMYKLCHLLSTVDFDHSNIRAVQVSTVDAFQGAEKEIIILSCVRTRQVGFIDSEKRMNVALTRGKRHLLIVGNIACLRKNRLWGRVIQHCEGREDGLQHASQYEPWLNHLLKDYLEKRAEEKQQKKSEKEKSPSKLLSQTDIV